MLTVHLRINDTGSGKPTPVRLRITTTDGTHFAPLGRCVEFPVGRNEAVGAGLNLARELWFTIDGACEIPLPAGVPLRVQATKGPEYTPLDETVTLGPGQLTLRLPIQRWVRAADDGWMSLDTRCHFLTPHDALLEAAAEGIDVANLLAVTQRFPAQNGTAYLMIPNLTAFSGQVPALERDGTSVVVNTLNVHPVLGSVGLLNSHRPVYPLAFGGDEETDDWGICDWCDQCHRKGGLTVWVDAFEPAGGLVGGEALVAAILGKIDAIEVSPGTRKVPLMPWVYRLWNAGVMIPLVGGSGKDCNRVPLGGIRTYAKTNAGEPTWLNSVRAGQTFVTNGPLVKVESIVNADRITVSASSRTYFEKLELIANGETIAVNESSVEEPFHATIDIPRPSEPSWIAARCLWAAGFFRASGGVAAFGGAVFAAHTSPVVIGTPPRGPEAVAALRKLIDQTREWAERYGRYANPKRREQLLARCAEAADKLGGGA